MSSMPTTWLSLKAGGPGSGFSSLAAPVWEQQRAGLGPRNVASALSVQPSPSSSSPGQPAPAGVAEGVVVVVGVAGVAQGVDVQVGLVADEELALLEGAVGHVVAVVLEVGNEGAAGGGPAAGGVAGGGGGG